MLFTENELIEKLGGRDKLKTSFPVVTSSQPGTESSAAAGAHITQGAGALQPSSSDTSNTTAVSRLNIKLMVEIFADIHNGCRCSMM